MKSKSKKQKSIDRKNAVDGEFKDVVVVNNLNDVERKKNLIADLVKQNTQDEQTEKDLKKQKLIEMLVGEVLEEKKADEEPAKKADEEPVEKINKQEAAKNSAIKKEELKKDSKKNTEKSKAKSNRSSLVSMLAGEEPVKEDQASPKNISQSENSLNQPLFNSKSEEHLSSLINELIPKNNLPLFLEKVKMQGSSGNSSLNIKTKKKTKGDVLLIHWNGRFGNRMHTYAYIHNRAKKFGGQVYLPSDWEGKQLFNLDYKIIDDDELRLAINQSIQPFDSLDHRLKKLREFNDRSEFNFQYCNPDNPTQTYKDFKSGVAVDSVCAYHHKIFDDMKLEDVLKLYEFNDKVKNLDIYKRLEDKQGTYDIAHLRRDDISNVNYKKNGGYSVISKEAYLKAFEKFGYNPDEIEWTSDDWSGKWGVGNSIAQGAIERRGSWTYPVGAEVLPGIIFDWLPDFLRLYFARSIFRANSSFSFWACTLSKGRENPPRIFAPRLDHRILYAKKETYEQETEFDFEEGNHPHWLCITGKDNCDNILFSDEPKPKPNKK